MLTANLPLNKKTALAVWRWLNETCFGGILVEPKICVQANVMYAGKHLLGAQRCSDNTIWLASHVAVSLQDKGQKAIQMMCCWQETLFHEMIHQYLGQEFEHYGGHGKQFWDTYDEYLPT